MMIIDKNELYRYAFIGILSELTDEKFNIQLEIEHLDVRFVMTDSKKTFDISSEWFDINKSLTLNQLKIFVEIMWNKLQRDRECLTIAYQMAETANRRIDDLLKTKGNC